MTIVLLLISDLVKIGSCSRGDPIGVNPHLSTRRPFWCAGSDGEPRQTLDRPSPNLRSCALNAARSGFRVSPRHPTNSPLDPSAEFSPPEQPDPVTDAEIGALEQLASLQEQAEGAGWSVWVEKRAADGVTWNKCRRLPFDGFDLERLPQLFGGGEFRLAVCNERNRFERRGIRVNFDPAAWPDVNPAAAPLGAPSPAQASEITELRARLERQEIDRQKFLETLITALLTRSSGPSLKELVEVQLQLRELNPPAPPPRSELSTLVEAMKVGGALVSGRAIDPDSDSGSGDVLDRVLDKVPKLIDMFTSKPPQPIPAPAPRGPVPVRALPAQNPPGDPMPAKPTPAPIPAELQPYVFLRQFSPTLQGWAQSEFSPARVASGIYDLVPDQHLPALDQFVHLPPAQRQTILAQLDPKLVAYAPYLSQVADALAKLIDTEASDSDEDESGDADPA